MEVNGIVQMYQDTEIPTSARNSVENLERGSENRVGKESSLNSAATIVNVNVLNDRPNTNTLETQTREAREELEKIDSAEFNVDSYYGSQEELKKEGTKRRRGYLCFKSKKGVVTCIILLLVTLIVVIALLLFFLLPRMPQISIQKISSPLKAQVESVNNIININVAMTVQVKIENGSFLPVNIKDTSVLADWQITGDTSGNRPFGNGTLPNVSISGRSSSIVEIPFNIIYSGDYRNDPMLVDFVNRCTNVLFESRVIEMKYGVYLKGKTTPSITANHKIGCPLTVDQVNGILALIQQSGGTTKIPVETSLLGSK